jgi:23S rRNA (guanine2445-N2)-methyltransferase / 23S rRNA (guanine2069-N7)-methyltransferase
MTTLSFIASSPRGLSDLLLRELASFGADEARERATGVAFAGGLEVAYRACLESRVANRIFLILKEIQAEDAESFYRGVREIDWTEHLGPQATLACDFSGRHPAITHTHFGALKLKDAIVDTLRERTGTRPDVNAAAPDVRVHAHAHGTRITVSLDLSGDSLHRRGYRGAAGEAPLKENVAAGVLLRAGWPALVAQGAPLLDPMCGSGTFVIEAALIAADHAPNLGRKYFGFDGWRGHDRSAWERVVSQAQARSRLAGPPQVSLRGSDQDPRAISVARANAQAAGAGGWVSFETAALSAAAPGEGSRPGLLVVNPPYGVRLEDRERARILHRQLGAVLKERFQGWTAAVLTGEPEMGKELGIRAHRTHTLWNGAIECRLLRMQVTPQSEREPGRLARPDQAAAADSPGARMFANRLGKNLKRLSAWARREGVSCYRIYDADMPEYAFALDLYRTVEPAEDWLYVQEYAAPADIEIEAVRRRRREALSSLTAVTGIPTGRIRVRTRRRSKRGEQYEKIDDSERFHVVSEAGLSLRVNFEDYLDTGLFLDHRITRARLREAARGARFLNLFAYTGTATVYAAAGGARSSTSVDMSRTYLAWARQNLALNGFNGLEHQLVQADCLKWLDEPARERERYDLVFLDPPTFSNSKRMEGVLDVERDHPRLIEACMRLLAPQGLLVFSTNAQRFRLDSSIGERHLVRDVSGETLPPDFERNPRIHRVFELRLRGDSSLSSSGGQGLPSRSPQ